MLKIHKIYSSVFFILCTFFSAASLANTIVPSAGQNEEISILSELDSNGEFDTLSIRPANEYGISVNKFDSFNVDSKSLKILNVSTSEAIGSARIIVIEANQINLKKQSVDILGSAADIIFISTSNGSVICEACEFNNIYRAMLSVANKIDPSTNEIIPLDVNTSNIGAIKPSLGGMVSIQGLTARGALGVEIVTDIMYSAGVIETRQLARYEDSGEGGEGKTLKLDESGTKTIGAASYSVALGGVTWDFDSRNMIGIEHIGSSGDSLVGSTVYATAIKVFSSFDIWVWSGKYDTKSDYTSTIRYPQWNSDTQSYVNKTHIVNEGVTIQSFSESIDGSLTFQKHIETNGDILIRSKNALEVSGYSMLWKMKSEFRGKNINLVSAGRLSIGGEIEAENLSIGGKTFVNTGILTTTDSVEIYAENNIVNEFGGEIRSEKVRIQSDDGLVRNGSRTPYRVDVREDTTIPLSLSSKDLHMVDSYTIGTFFREGLDINFEEATKLNIENPSQIFGRNILIQGRAFENINPYWEYVTDQSAVEIPYDNSFRVAIQSGSSPDKKASLAIKARDYILNSSAVIASEGDIWLDSPIVLNERYKVLSTLDGAIITNSNVKDSSATTDVIAYSPPGLISSLEDLTVRSQIGLSNQASYIDVYGDGNFWANKLTLYGVEAGTAMSTKVVTKRRKDYYDCWKNLILRSCYRWDYYDVITSANHNPEVLDALFSIRGNSFGRNFSVNGAGETVPGVYADLFVSSVNAFDAYVNEMMAGVFETDGYDGFNESHSIVYDTNGTALINSSQYIHTFDHCDPNAPDILVPISVGGITTFIPVRDCQAKTKHIATTNNLLDMLYEFYLSIKETMESWLEYINWWETENA